MKFCRLVFLAVISWCQVTNANPATQWMGFDNPLGKYPAPVVPIVKDYAGLSAIYWQGGDTIAMESVQQDALYVHKEGVKFIKFYDKKSFLNRFLDRAFQSRVDSIDLFKENLFALSESEVVVYSSADEAEFFKAILSDPSIAEEDPFSRLSWAELTGELELIQKELSGCVYDMDSRFENAEQILNIWYEKSKSSLKGLWEQANLEFPSIQALRRP